MESLEIARLLREAFPQEVLDIQEFRGQMQCCCAPGASLMCWSTPGSILT